MQRKTGISRHRRASTAAAADGGLAAWLARYAPVEREIIEAHERRIASRMRNDARRREADARAFGDLCEATEARLPRVLLSCGGERGGACARWCAGRTATCSHC